MWTTAKKLRQQTKCKHGRDRSRCKDFGRSQSCEHNKMKSRCKDCGGGQICKHDNIRSDFRDCSGGQICERNKIKSQCKDCDALGHLTGVLRGRIYTVLKNDKDMSSTEHLGCNIETFKQHFERQLTEDMSWENYSE